MTKWMMAILLLAWPVIGTAADLTTGDFAYGLRIDVPQGTAVAALDLPQTVYTSTCRADLGDLRVFNTRGEPVPHLLQSVRTEKTEQPWTSLPFFPLPEIAGDHAGGYRVMVRTGPNGTVVSVDPPTPLPADTAPRSFLVDLSRFDGRLHQLRIAWIDDGQRRMSQFRVETSDDLVAWSTVQPRWAVASIRYGGHQLHNDTLTVPVSTGRYLRLQQTDDGAPLIPTRIDGRLRTEASGPVRVFLSVDGTADPDQPGVFHYTLDGAFPIDRVNLHFDQANSMADTIFESRNDPKAAWTRRGSGLFYRIDIDWMRLESASQPVGTVVDRFWRLTVKASQSTIGGGHIPRLHVGYRPHDLYFIARGAGAFTLAFGSGAVEPAGLDVDRLFDGIRRQHQAPLARRLETTGPRFTLGGPQRLVPPPKALPMRRIVLWSILLGGVLVVAVMAWRLARRMR